MLHQDGSGGDSLPTTHCPACQVAGCFESAAVYVVIKESDINALGMDVSDKKMLIEKESPTDINTFKLILYLCARHDYDLKYLLKENELEITKRRRLILKEIQ